MKCEDSAAYFMLLLLHTYCVAFICCQRTFYRWFFKWYL